VPVFIQTSGWRSTRSAIEKLSASNKETIHRLEFEKRAQFEAFVGRLAAYAKRKPTSAKKVLARLNELDNAGATSIRGHYGFSAIELGLAALCQKLGYKWKGKPIRIAEPCF
jgi:hypothetical protein